MEGEGGNGLGTLKFPLSLFKVVIKFTRISPMAESHCIQADLCGFSLVSLPRGRWERSIPEWSSKSGCYRGRSRNQRMVSLFSWQKRKPKNQPL